MFEKCYSPDFSSWTQVSLIYSFVALGKFQERGKYVAQEIKETNIGQYLKTFLSFLVLEKKYILRQGGQW